MSEGVLILNDMISLINGRERENTNALLACLPLHSISLHSSSRHSLAIIASESPLEFPLHLKAVDFICLTYRVEIGTENN